MEWIETTAPDFAKAVGKCERTCVIPLGVIEKHGDHLPLGTDALNSDWIVNHAAEQEPVMVFPMFYFGQNAHAKCSPGAVNIKPEILSDLLESVCDEICRNGFNKIIFFNSHGGNSFWLNYFMQTMLDREKPYMLYLSCTWNARKTIHPEAFQAKEDGHAGEFETCCIMAETPDLVTGQPGDYGRSMKREQAFRDLGIATASWWYAEHPDNLCADQTICSAEKGRIYLDEQVKHFVQVIRLVKKDDTPFNFYREFHKRTLKPECEK